MRQIYSSNFLFAKNYLFHKKHKNSKGTYEPYFDVAMFFGNRCVTFYSALVMIHSWATNNNN